MSSCNIQAMPMQVDSSPLAQNDDLHVGNLCRFSSGNDSTSTASRLCRKGRHISHGFSGQI